MKNKSLILALGLCVSICPSIFAQASAPSVPVPSTPPPVGHPEGRGQGPLALLGLTPSQRQQLDALLQQHRVAVEQVVKNPNLTRGQKIEQRGVLASQLEAAVKKVMTPAQYTQFVQIQLDRERAREALHAQGAKSSTEP